MCSTQIRDTVPALADAARDPSLRVVLPRRHQIHSFPEFTQRVLNPSRDGKPVVKHPFIGKMGSPLGVRLLPPFMVHGDSALTTSMRLPRPPGVSSNRYQTAAFL